jgi:subtilase family serine protease
VIRRLSVFFLAVVAMMSVTITVCQAQPQSLLTRHVREAVINGQAQSVGRLPATQSMRFDVVLALRHQPELENFLQEVSDPSSPSYRHFVTPEEFTARFGPSQEDYDSVIRFAKANGFTVVGGSRDGLDVQLKGSVAAIEKAFHVTMGVYQHPTEKRTFFAPDREPTVDLPFQLWRISGLDNFSIPRPLYLHKNKQAIPNVVKGSCPGSTYCGSDMRAAYYGGTLTGTGQNIALLELAGSDLADLTTYYHNVGQTEPFTPTLVSTGGFSTACLASSGCDDGEQTLDMTQAMGMAPGSTMLYMYVCGDAFGTGTFNETDCLSAMSTAKPLSNQISCSWAWQPADPKSDDPFYQKFAVQGQNFFVASGDGGSYPSASRPFYDPAEDDFVTAVGGTDLQVTKPGGPWSSETAWIDSGGGISQDSIPIPAWQQLAGVINVSNKGSKTLRNVPDVAAEANFDFYVCADQTACQSGFGGTSFAAPMWAGYMALVNQQAIANGNSPLGFINPAVYNIGIGSGYGAAFHDITVGGNGGFSAVTGYDLVTGWGSPNGAGLINALAGSSGPNFTLSASPSSVSVAQGSAGTSTITVTPVNGFSGSVTMSASGLPSGVTAGFSPNPTTTTSTLTLTASATAATGTSTVTVTGVSGSLTQTTTLSLTVTSSGGGAAVTLTPTSLAFGNIVLAEASPAKPVTVKNTGTATLNITSIAASGSGYAISSNACGATLAVGKTCIVKVTFTPTALGLSSGNLTFTDNAANSPQTVPLSGTGIAQATLTPATATYPATKVGVTSAAKVFTLTNKQNVSLTGIAISTTGDFSESTTTCTTTLAAKANCKISVVFKPTATGTRTGALKVADSASNSPQTSALTGTGK